MREPRLKLKSRHRGCAAVSDGGNWVELVVGWGVLLKEGIGG